MEPPPRESLKELRLSIGFARGSKAASTENPPAQPRRRQDSIYIKVYFAAKPPRMHRFPQTDPHAQLELIVQLKDTRPEELLLALERKEPPRSSSRTPAAQGRQFDIKSTSLARELPRRPRPAT